MLSVAALADNDRTVPRWEPARYRVKRRGTTALAVARPTCVNSGLVLVALLVSVAVVLVSFGVFGQLGANESDALRTELRGQGFIVTAVEKVSIYRGNDGRETAAPEGAAVYRVSFRAADNSEKVAYRIATGFLGDRWSFPDGR
jgi:hypothetical protein